MVTYTILYRAEGQNGSRNEPALAEGACSQPLSFVTYRKEVRAGADHRGFFFRNAEKFEHKHPLSGVLPVRIEAPHPHSGSLDRDEFFDRETGLFHFCSQFVGVVKECRREILRIVRRIAVLAVPQVLPDNLDKCRISEQVACHAAQKGCETGYRPSEDETARAQHAECFDQTRQPICPYRQVIEGAKQGIYAAIGVAKITGIACRATRQWVCRLGFRGSARSLDVVRDRVDEMDFMPLPCQPQGVYARCASYVENDGSRLRQASPDEVLRSDALQFSRATGKTLGFVYIGVVIEHLRRQRVIHLSGGS